jgi:2-methylaconitate cis-trans-isomerase PrpF
MRGGTSKAIVFRAADLPADRAERDAIFLAAIGSPDPNGRQLDGMGGGISSLSKVCVVGPPSRPDADVDYTFAQIAIDEAAVDYAGNCGNMSSAIGPFAVDEGLVTAPADGEATVRIHNTNTGKIIVARFPVQDGRAIVEGELAIDGVAGTGAPIRLDFTDPGGAKTGKLLPTGRALDVLEVPGLGSIGASLVDAANPCVFVAAADLGLAGTELPTALERDAGLMRRLEAIRRQAAVAMGIAGDLEAAGAIRSIPKIALLAAPADAAILSGRIVPASEADILARTIEVGQPHPAGVSVGERDAVGEERRRERAEQEVLERGLLAEQPAAASQATHDVKREREHFERDEQRQQVVGGGEDHHAEQRKHCQREDLGVLKPRRSGLGLARRPGGISRAAGERAESTLEAALGEKRE